MKYEDVANLCKYINGALYWKISPARNVFSGDRAGTLAKNGYVQIRVHGKIYKEHRLIYLLHHKILPKMLDHIDGKRSNNKIENLRIASYSENNLNRPVHKRSATGVKNVSFCCNSNKYKVGLAVNNKFKHIGYFNNIELAELVAIEARDKYHGAFACHK